MPRAHSSDKVVLAFAMSLCAGGPLSLRHAPAAQAARATAAQSTGLIRDRRQVPSDPLAGLPEEEPDPKATRSGQKWAG